MQVISTTPPPSVSAQRIYRRYMYIVIGYVAAVLVINTLLVTFGVNLSGRQIPLALSAGMVIGPVLFMADFLVARHHFRPIFTGLKAVESGPTRHELIQKALVRAFNLPLLTIFRVLTYHSLVAFGGATIVVLLWNKFFAMGVQPWQIVGLWGSFFISVLAHAIIEYFTVIAEMQPVIGFLQALTDEGCPVQEQQVMRVNTRQRLLALSIWMAFVPLGTLSFTTLVRVRDLLVGQDEIVLFNSIVLWVIILTAFVTIISIVIANLLANYTNTKMTTLVHAMSQVESGQLDLNLEVTTTDEFADLYQGFNSMIYGLKERERLNDAFGRYVSPELAEQIRAEGVTMSGQVLTASVMFVDIRDYTPLSEQMNASEVVELLNRFFACIEPVIKAEGGWINKFLGDGFMAVFGAPVSCSDHAARAVRAARNIIEETTRFNHLPDNDYNLRIGISIDCGQMVAGSVGSPDRVEYTVIGNAVNTAARIEALNKEYQTVILISEAVYEQAGLNDKAHPMPPTKVKGVTEPVSIYTLDESLATDHS